MRMNAVTTCGAGFETAESSTGSPVAALNRPVAWAATDGWWSGQWPASQVLNDSHGRCTGYDSAAGKWPRI